jgi:hypothetical protein
MTRSRASCDWLYMLQAELCYKLWHFSTQTDNSICYIVSNWGSDTEQRIGKDAEGTGVVYFNVGLHNSPAFSWRDWKKSWKLMVTCLRIENPAWDLQTMEQC